MSQSHSCLLIDDMGRMRIWPSADATLGLTDRDVDFDFPAYAVRNLGYVAIVETASSTRVWLRPLFIADLTASALLRHISARQPRRSAISYFDAIWQHEICGCYDVAIRRLVSILGDRTRTSPPEPYIATRRSIQRILVSGRDPFAPLLNLWMDGAYPDDLPDLLQRHGLYERAMIVEREPSSGHFVFRHSGRGIELYDRTWSDAALGRRVDEQPDRIYGHWIATACADVDAHQVPRFELIHAMVRHPDGPMRSWRYERLMLPWRTQKRRIVVSVTRPDQGRRRIIPG